MNGLRLSENIGRLRREKRITQDELATFLSITKASVSKWETGQSYPDILLLPQIASYFDISIDELLGYEPQMSREQIRKIYLELSEDFSKLPFNEVMDKSRSIVKKYYSCYPLLTQIVLLWINHFMIVSNKEIQDEILKESIELCNHIIENSNDAGLFNEVITFKSIANLSLGNGKGVVEELEPLLANKDIILQLDPILIQAYQMIGDISKAEFYSQITIYTNLLNLISNSIGMINFKIQDKDFCEKTFERIRKVIYAYDIGNLNENIYLQYKYQKVIFHCVHLEKDKAIIELKNFVNGTIRFIEKGVVLHGDNYFNRLEKWFDGFALKVEAPRSGKVIMDSLIPALENPVLGIIFQEEEYKDLKNKIERRKEGK